MIAVVSDTHSRSGHALEGRALAAVREADLVVHAGDFVSESALDAFERTSARLIAVHGNVDSPGVRDRLPPVRAFSEAGVRFALTHRRDGGEQALALFGREQGADLVVFGHSHRPGFEDIGAIALLNPGSHADPRGNPASHAELEPVDDGLRGTIRRRDGSVVREFAVKTG